jgi:hypothetical protein
MAAILIAYSASPAHAALDSCTTTAGTTTCTYVPSGSEDTFEVPLGVSSIHVEATGAPGGVGRGGSSAGRGATVSGKLTGLNPGQTLYVEVGGAPTEVVGTCNPRVACVGGFNGGGEGINSGGGGGGASDVRTVPRPQSGDQSESLNSRLIVAGGGGGSDFADPCIRLLGGGGAAGSDGGVGNTCLTLSGGTGGKAGDANAGGLGGSPDGQSGSLGLGGGGGGIMGGGGGGGLFGGGGGGTLTS